MNQLPGYGPKKTISSGWWLILALLGAVAFAALRYASAGHFTGDGSSAYTSVEPHVPISPTKTEDQLQHLDNALSNLKEASAAAARFQDLTDRALSSLDDPALTARRLQAARTASRSAEAQIDHAYVEIEMANSILVERSQQ